MLPHQDFSEFLVEWKAPYVFVSISSCKKAFCQFYWQVAEKLEFVAFRSFEPVSFDKFFRYRTEYKCKLKRHVSMKTTLSFLNSKQRYKIMRTELLLAYSAMQRIAQE